MSDPFVGEIRMFGGNFAPLGWAFCMGQLMPISENDTLFSLIGTTYGGDGQSTFALPDLRGRVPIHMGTSSGRNFVPGEMGGAESVTLIATQMPVHTHTLAASLNNALSADPANQMPGRATSVNLYGTGASAAMDANSIAPVGGSQAHENMMPSLAVNFIISLYGIYPPPS